ncbi:MAG: hypothetical protein LUH09_03030 [Clostridiales bacterium]|nr:hypothetical protein [Clostridiales bacterium]
MKKQYIAPDLYFESIVLSESIALGCDADGITGAEGLNELDGYFMDNTRLTCKTEWTHEYDGMWEGYCYWSGTTQLSTS